MIKRAALIIHKIELVIMKADLLSSDTVKVTL